MSRHKRNEWVATAFWPLVYKEFAEKEINCRPLCQVGRKQLKVSGEVTLFEWRTRESIQPVGLISSVYWLVINEEKSLAPIKQKTIDFYDDEITAVLVKEEKRQPVFSQYDRGVLILESPGQSQ